ncbi:hypothetical protein V502_01321 [Pseudogymnoascus sp. VKM F-4520 (FW-2644)]|nr:hypothetical protein V502_01321 [Pseudogymnoascus sp. VKM F-4520 (FW-2644)]
MALSTAPNVIIDVVGSATTEWLNYPPKNDSKDEHYGPNRETCVTKVHGGAMLLAELIKNLSGLASNYDGVVKGPDEIESLANISGPEEIESLANISKFRHVQVTLIKDPDHRSKDDAKGCFRVDKTSEINELSKFVTESKLFLKQCQNEEIGEEMTKILVISESQGRNNGQLDKIELRKKYKKIIYSVFPSYGNEPNYLEGIEKFLESLKPSIPELIVVVDAKDLRIQGLKISRQLSWERTVTDLVQNLKCHKSLRRILSFPHVVITFNCDGAIYFNKNMENLKLYFDPRSAEGDFSWLYNETMTGLPSAFVAGLATNLRMENDMEKVIDSGIPLGIKAARELLRKGFQYPDGDSTNANGYPTPEYCKISIDPNDTKDNITGIPIDPKVADSNDWTILAVRSQQQSSQQPADNPQEHIAEKIVKYGWDELKDVPVAKFGNLVTADRQEIEGYRVVANLVSGYLSKDRTKPLSIAVFGYPGSGKSFGVKEVIMETSKKKSKLEILELNLSQFTDFQDLVSAFHSIRDITLSDKTPLVLFDEFDSESKTGTNWLRYFLAPMQDGRFIDNGVRHPLGAAVFIFIGGRFNNFGDFKNYCKSDPASKAPDFESRLNGFVNVLGLNLRKKPKNRHDNSDHSIHNRAVLIRRAFVLRSMLMGCEEKLFKDGKILQIDDGVLRAFLEVTKYRHGARSVEKILEMSSLSNQERFTYTELPSKDQLALHVDSDEFTNLLKSTAISVDECGKTKTISFWSKMKKKRTL